MPVEKLNNRSLVRVGGEEADHFLDNLLTCDLSRAIPQTALFGGLLSPQGKILFDFFIFRTASGFLIDIDRDERDEFIKRLMFYRLRAKVTIEPEEGAVHVVWGSNAVLPDGTLAARDSRHPELGWRVHGGKVPDHGEQDSVAMADYTALRIALGIPEGGIDYSHGDAFPHDALFDQMGGVDFDKGCYIGQEVVSRMKHRSTARKRVIKVSSTDDLPRTGTKIAGGSASLGQLGSVVGKNGLALVRLDKVKAAMDRGEAISSEGVELNVSLPDWVSFGWPE